MGRVMTEIVPSEAGERILRLIAEVAPSGAQPQVNGNAAKALIRDGWLSGVKGAYSLTRKAKNFVAGITDPVTTESRGVRREGLTGQEYYVTEYRGTCEHGNVSAWLGSNGEAVDSARDHGDNDGHGNAWPEPDPSDGYTADWDARMLLATRAMSIGYTGEGAGDLAERAYYVGTRPAPCGDECDTHPGIRRYSDGECEACEVERQFFAAARVDETLLSEIGDALAAAVAERPCALVCGTSGPHQPLCSAASDLICQADFGTGYCVLPVHTGYAHRDMYGNTVLIATTRRLGDPEPSNPVTGAMVFAVREWERHATFADASMLANMITVMDRVSGSMERVKGSVERNEPGQSREVGLFDAGTAYGMLLMCRTVVGTVIGGNHTAESVLHVIDYVRSNTTGKVVAP